MQQQQAIARRREAMVKGAAPETAVKVKQEFIDTPMSMDKGTAATPVVIDEEEGSRSHMTTNTTAMGNVRINNNEGVVGVTNVNGDVYIQTSLKGTKQGTNKTQRTSQERPKVNFMHEFEAEVDAEVEKKYATPTKGKPTQQKPGPPEIRRSARIQGASKAKQDPKAKTKEARPKESTHQEERATGINKKSEASKNTKATQKANVTSKDKRSNKDNHQDDPTTEANTTTQKEIDKEQPQEGGTEEDGDKAGMAQREAQGEESTKQQSGGHTKPNNLDQGGREERKHPQPNEDTTNDPSPQTKEASEAQPSGDSTKAKKTMAQAVMTEPVILKRQHSFRLQFSFITTGTPNVQITMAKAQASHLHKAVTDLLEQAQAIDSTAVINTWATDDKYSTIQRREDVPTEYEHIIKFVRPPPGAKFKTGTTNWYWGVQLSTDSKMKEFLQVWEEERRKTPKADRPAPIRAAPLQAEEWHECGLFIGSTANQETSTLLEGIKQELRYDHMGLNWQSIPFPGSQKMWSVAKARGKEDGPRAKFASAPMALQVLVAQPWKVKPTLKQLYQKYGQVDNDGSWPTLPDGSKMRFIPNFKFTKDAMSKKRIARRMQLQVQMHYNNRVYPIPVRDPTAAITVEDTGVERHTTVGNLVLENVCKVTEGEVTVNEPYFRHFVKRWAPKSDRQIYDIAVHDHMKKFAKEKLKSLTKDLIEKYGETIKPHLILPSEAGIDRTLQVEDDEDDEMDFSLGDSDDDSVDMYMTKKNTTFVFEGLEQVTVTDGPGPGGGQSNIAFTVKSGTTKPNQAQSDNEQNNKQTDSTTNQTQNDTQSEVDKDGFRKVQGRGRTQGNATPHRKAKDPDGQGQKRP